MILDLLFASLAFLLSPGCFFWECFFALCSWAIVREDRLVWGFGVVSCS